MSDSKMVPQPLPEPSVEFARDIDTTLDALIPTGPLDRESSGMPLVPGEALPASEIIPAAVETRPRETIVHQTPQPQREARPPEAPGTPDAPEAPQAQDAPGALPEIQPIKATQTSGSVATARSRGRWVPLLVLLAGWAVVNLAGLPYYLAPVSARVRSPLHPWLRPSGYIGQSVGILALVMFLFLYLYPLRKRFRVLAFTGALNRWLDVHITAGLLMPLLGATHATWQFKGLVGLGYVSLVLVALSGIVGKYLYAKIPRSRSGVELSLEEVDSRRRDLIRRIAGATGIDETEIQTMLDRGTDSPQGRGVLAGLLAMVTDDLARFRKLRRLRRQIRAGSRGSAKLSRAALREVVRLARREVTLTQQRRMLDSTQRIFGYWHVVHRPFSVTAFVAVAIHVIAVITLRVTWFW